MGENIDFLHHVGLMVHDIRAATQRYEELGFSFGPASSIRFALEPGSEPQDIGASKNDAIFERNFLEIAAISDRVAWKKLPDKLHQRFDLDGFLSRYQGIHMVYFGTNNLEKTYSRLSASNLRTSPIGSMNREVQTADGTQTLRAKFTHAASVSFAQFENPEALFHQANLAHPNGAKRLTGLIVCTEDPSDLASTYSRYTGQPVKTEGAVRLLELGHSSVTVVGAQDLEKVIPGCKAPCLPFYAGFTVATESLGRTRSFLQKSSVRFQEHDGRLVVHPDDASGSAILFEAEANKA